MDSRQNYVNKQENESNTVHTQASIVTVIHSFILVAADLILIQPILGCDFDLFGKLAGD